MNTIPVTFANLFTHEQLAQFVLPSLPMSGDTIFLEQLGCEVVRCEWQLKIGKGVELLVLVQPQIDASGKRPFAYPKEETG